MSSALPPPRLPAQQVADEVTSLDARHSPRQVAQVLPSLSSPLLSQQTFRRPHSRLRPPRTSERHSTTTRWPTQGHEDAAGVVGVAGEVRDRGMGGGGWRKLHARSNSNNTNSPLQLHATAPYATISGMASARVRAPGDRMHPYSPAGSLFQAPSAFTRKGAGGGGLFCVRLKNATQKSQRKIRGGRGLFCVRYVGSPRVVPNAK